MAIRRLVGVCVALAAVAAPLHGQTETRVYGTVTDSVHMRPLGGATVRVAPMDSGAVREVTTDAHGAYVVRMLRADTYVVTVRHPWLDSTGLAIEPDTVALAAGAVLRVDLGVPSPATIFTESCHSPPDRDHGILVGYVRDAERGAPVPRAVVGVLWSDFTFDMKTLRLHTFERGGYVRTDSAGAFRACDVPRGKRLTIQAQLDTVRRTGLIDAQVDSSGLLLEALRLDVRPHTSPVGPYVISGVVKAQDGSVVPHPRVSLAGDTVRTTGDAEGNFHLGGLYGGTVGLQVRAIGYSPAAVVAEVGATSAPVEVFLMPAAVMLDSVRSFARRAGVPEWRGEFDERLRSHVSGTLLTAADIRQRNPFETTELLRMVPWLKVDGTGLDATVTLRHKASGGDRIGVRCPQVYVDGVEWKAEESLNLIAPSSVYGLEMYQQGDIAPTGYVNQCGLVVFWTK